MTKNFPMHRRSPSNGRRRGITLIETMVATTIITVSMLGAVGIFMSTGTLSDRTAENSVASTLARRAVEEARNLGFSSLSDGTVTRYYDRNGNGGAATTSNSDRFKVVSVVSSDIVTNGVPDPKALRTLTVTVRRNADNSVLETSATYFAWGGI